MHTGTTHLYLALDLFILIFNKQLVCNTRTTITTFLVEKVCNACGRLYVSLVPSCTPLTNYDVYKILTVLLCLYVVQDDAPLSDRKPLWRKAIMKHKLVACDRCLTYQAVSVPSMAYHYERCGRVSTILSANVHV